MTKLYAVRWSRLASTIVVGGAAASSFYPRRKVYAESPPQDDLPEKKPIYSNRAHLMPFHPSHPSNSSPDPSQPDQKNQKDQQPPSPTPTDRLTAQVKRARLFLYDQSLSAENHINGALSWAFTKENNFTNTIASLAPDPRTGEQLLPGAIYVLVATMAGSIISRNRGLFLRTTVPIAVGITAGWMLIPVTMQNIADLSWKYEKKVPFISETHATIRGFVVEGWRQTRDRSKAAARWADETAGESRKKVENWVEKGK